MTYAAIANVHHFERALVNTCSDQKGCGFVNLYNSLNNNKIEIAPR
jgi:hypothetical protein